VPVVVYPVPVQGAGAAREIAAMLELADARGEADVLLLVRGGGSLEDLWAFNDEALARAIAATRLPVICGIGHEVDFTIADFAADLRAPTPSAAAELAVPDGAAWLSSISLLGRRLAAGAGRAFGRRQEAVARVGRRLATLHPARALAERAQRLDELQLRAAGAMRRLAVSRELHLARLCAELSGVSPGARIAALAARTGHARARLLPALRHLHDLASARLDAAARGLNAVSPLATLARGYAIATLAADGRMVTDPAQAPVGTELALRLARGQLHARVTRRR
jgi:exodeoxyribonuclease VII large subunit